jgi:hypothetical protein
VFYLFLFDFSLGALDRYFEFLVVPLCVISGAVFSQFLFESPAVHKDRKMMIGGFSLLAVLIFLVQFFHHSVPSQYPKTEWIGRILSLKWNFLFPFTGGSGPTGFYVSFAFMGIMWIAGLLLVLKKRTFLIGILILGLAYNLVFAEEYLFGKINGSPYKLFEDAKQFIIADPQVTSVIDYNDIGGYELQQTGKYFRRMYATPQFEDEYKKILENFTGQILYINIPRIQSGSFYEQYFNSCKNIFTKTDRAITATIYDCTKKQ